MSYSGVCIKMYINFHNNQIIKDFQILKRERGRVIMEKIQFFYSGACKHMLCINFHENRIINKDFQIYRVSREGRPLFNCPIAMQIESRKMLIWFNIFPMSRFNILSRFRVISFYILDGRKAL